MAVLLTGGLGYIGSHTAAALAAADIPFVIADDLSNTEIGVLAALEELSGKKIPFYEIDVADKAALEKLFSENKIEAVIHFAGYKSVGESVAAPLKYYRNNIDTALTLLEVMKAHGCKRIVFSSSATVYGSHNPVPFTEDMPTGGCTNPYGWTKYMLEQVITDTVAAEKDFSAVLLRYFNPIGAHESGLLSEKPRGVPENLMPYIAQTAAGIREKLRVYGNDYPTPDGTGVRDYIHVCDLAAGHLCALAYSEAHTGTEIFNLGTGRGNSVLEVVETFERVNGVKVPYEIVERRPGDIASACAGVEKAKTVLGWSAERGIEEMCRDSWKPYKAQF